MNPSERPQLKLTSLDTSRSIVWDNEMLAFFEYVTQLEAENENWHKVNAENTELMEAMMSRIKELEAGGRG